MSIVDREIFLRLTSHGIDKWNDWRRNSLYVPVNLTNSDLSGMDLRHIDLSLANLSGSRLRGTIFNEANLLSTRFTNADIRDAAFHHASLTGTNFRNSIAHGAGFSKADFYGTDLSGANLTGANFIGASLVNVNVEASILDDCQVWATSVWDIVGEPASQRGLIITPKNQAPITVDNLELAQFLYLLLNSRKLRSVIDSMTSRAVLILGRFSPERKAVLNQVADLLRAEGLVPVIFDWEGPSNRSLTETVSTIAHLSRFVVADISDPRSIPQELQRIVPGLPSVPIVPILHEEHWEYGMFDDFRDYPNLLDLVRYFDEDDLASKFQAHVIMPASQFTESRIEERAHRRRS